MQNVNKRIWQLCCFLVFVIVVLGFTIAIPQNTFQPQIWGFPFTLWMGILLSILLVVLTVLGTLVHPGNKKSDKS